MYVLIADDDRSIRLLVSMILESQGHTVETVEDGQELIERLQRPFNRSFDLVITDNTMPRKSGIEVLRWIRESEYFKKLPVIVHTGDDSSDTRAFIEGMGGVLALKGDARNLISAIKKFK